MLTSSNDEYIFVSISSTPLEEQVAEIRSCSEDPPDFIRADEEAEVRRLHKLYSQSGVYRNDGSTNPIWTTNDEDVYGRPTDDGKWVLSWGYYGYFLEVTGKDGIPSQLFNYDVTGYTAMTLYWIAGESWPCMEDYAYLPTNEELLVTFDDDATATIRLDDFTVVQSNVLPNAIATLLTTPRGIAFVLFVISLGWGITWAVSQWCRAR